MQARERKCSLTSLAAPVAAPVTSPIASRVPPVAIPVSVTVAPAAPARAACNTRYNRPLALKPLRRRGVQRGGASCGSRPERTRVLRTGRGRGPCRAHGPWPCPCPCPCRGGPCLDPCPCLCRGGRGSWSVRGSHCAPRARATALGPSAAPAQQARRHPPWAAAPRPQSPSQAHQEAEEQGEGGGEEAPAVRSCAAPVSQPATQLPPAPAAPSSPPCLTRSIIVEAASHAPSFFCVEFI